MNFPRFFSYKIWISCQFFFLKNFSFKIWVSRQAFSQKILIASKIISTTSKNFHTCALQYFYRITFVASRNTVKTGAGAGDRGIPNKCSNWNNFQFWFRYYVLVSFGFCIYSYLPRFLWASKFTIEVNIVNGTLTKFRYPDVMDQAINVTAIFNLIYFTAIIIIGLTTVLLVSNKVKGNLF